jgi:hypothetical protein
MIGPDVLLKIYADQYFHHDRLMWGQLQTLIALQGATLVGGFVTRARASPLEFSLLVCFLRPFSTCTLNDWLRAATPTCRS